MSVRRSLPDLVPAAAAALLLGVLPAAAGPLHWDWPAGQPLSGVTLDGAALDEGGHLVAGLGARRLDPAGPEVFWCIAPDGKGGFYTGTGHGGQVHHTDTAGKSRLVAQLDAAEVFSLLVRPDGTLLAGCGPEGEVLTIAADGTVTAHGRVPGGYAWSLLEGADGTVWIAAGSPAAVWRLAKDGSLAAALDLPAQNVLDLAWDDAGRLLAATQGPGLVYRLDPDRPDRPELLFEADQGEVRQFLRGPDGGMFVLALDVGDPGQNGGGSGRARAAGNGNGEGDGNLAAAAAGMISLRDLQFVDGPARAALYRLDPDGLVTPYWSGESDLMIAAWTESWGWIGGGVQDETDGRAALHRLTPPAGMQALAGWDGGDVMAILPDPGRGRLVVCEAHPGALSELSPRPPSVRAAVSRTVDAGRPVHWGRLRWSGEGQGKEPAFAVRTGNRADPDADWSPWTAAKHGRDEAITAPPGRYLQWRVTFPDGAEASSWRVTSVSVSAWRDNLPPAITAFDVEQVREILAGGLMPRGDNVTQALRSGLRVEYSRQSGRDQRAAADRAAATRPVRTFSWRVEDPDGDRLVYDLEYRRQGDSAWRPVLTATEETLGAWDTAGLPDGAYELRLTASDRPDNPAAEAQVVRRVLAPVTVDNTPPVVSRLTVERTPAGVRVRFRAEDASSALAGAEVVLPDGSRERLDPADRICDSLREDFDREIAWPRDGAATADEPWPLRVEVRDLGGNLGFADAEVR
ncbi:MAG: hypothetical protein IH621_05550 [Krumholzibacteria bacterium]|nr:hypothetical protein [Candidatus Krumholzibacteria bacterium]